MSILLASTANPTLIEVITVSLPESVGLLIFGVMLAVAAVILRSFFARADRSKAEEEKRLVGR